MGFADVSAWFDHDDNALVEHINWITSNAAEKQLAFIQPRFEAAALKSAVEFGSGSGRLAFAWAKANPQLIYDGIEKSQKLYDLTVDPHISGLEAPWLNFHKGDVRDSAVLPTADCALAFAFMKHFSLDEWNDILAHVLMNGRYGAFDVQVAGQDHDNGTHYHHVYVSETRLLEAVRLAGHEILDRATWEECDVDGLGRMRNAVLWTKRRS